MHQRIVELIAEVGSVHDGSFGNACRLIDAAAASGADAVKFQMHIAEAETLTGAPSPYYFTSESREEYFRRTSFSHEEWAALKERAEDAGLVFLCSAFSVEALAELESLGVRMHKVPSGEVSNLPLLREIAATKKPILLSSGMSSWAELDAAVDILRDGGELTVLQCSTLYPCPPERVGLNVLVEMRNRYDLPIGLSDHTLGPAAAIAAVALGATVVEKHFTLSRLLYGSDAAHSTEPEEFSALAQALKETAAMLANPVDKDDISDYAQMKTVFEKSVVTRCDVAAGTVLSAEHLTVKKPGDGIAAAEIDRVIGRPVARDLPADWKLSEADLQ